MVRATIRVDTFEIAAACGHLAGRVLSLPADLSSKVCASLFELINRRDEFFSFTQSPSDRGDCLRVNAAIRTDELFAAALRGAEW